MYHVCKNDALDQFVTSNYVMLSVKLLLTLKKIESLKYWSIQHRCVINKMSTSNNEIYVYYRIKGILGSENTTPHLELIGARRCNNRIAVLVFITVFILRISDIYEPPSSHLITPSQRTSLSEHLIYLADLKAKIFD